MHDFLKQFISQIGIRYLDRIQVFDPPMNVKMGIKILNLMGVGIKIKNVNGDMKSKIKPKSHPFPSLIW